MPTKAELEARVKELEARTQSGSDANVKLLKKANDDIAGLETTERKLRAKIADLESHKDARVTIGIEETPSFLQGNAVQADVAGAAFTGRVEVKLLRATRK